MEEGSRFVPMAIKPRFIPKKFLSADENLLFESRKSAWSSMWAAAIFLPLAAILLVLAYWNEIPGSSEIPYLSDWLSDPDYGDLTQIVLIAFACLSILYVFWKWWIWGSTVYAITDERAVKLTRSWLAKDYASIPVTQIEDVRFHHPFWGRILGYGSISIFTGSPGPDNVGEIRWQYVPDPVSVSRILEDVIDIRSKPSRQRPVIMKDQPVGGEKLKGQPAGDQKAR